MPFYFQKESVHVNITTTTEVCQRGFLCYCKPCIAIHLFSPETKMKFEYQSCHNNLLLWTIIRIVWTYNQRQMYALLAALSLIRLSHVVGIDTKTNITNTIFSL